MRMRIAILILIGATAAAADLKPKQQEAKKSFEFHMKDVIKDVRDVCGIPSLPVTVNWEKYDAKTQENFEKRNYTMLGLCEPFVGAVIGLCRNDSYKPTIAKRLKEIRCLFGGEVLPAEVAKGNGRDEALAELTKRNISFKDGVFQILESEHNVDIHDKAWDAMVKELNK